AKFCVKASVQHAKRRVQFDQPLAEFELVKKKIAFMAAHTFATEAMTQICASYIDRGFEDYMLETAILKVFATEHLWTIINDTIQIHGGSAYFTDKPFERMMRDARINTIGEGANDVLKAFVAVVGCKGPGEALKKLRDDALARPLANLGKLASFGAGQLSARLTSPDVPVQSEQLRAEAKRLAGHVKRMGLVLPWVFWRARTEEVFVQN